MASARFRTALVGAAMAHAAFFALVRTSPPSPPAPPRDPSETPRLLDLELPSAPGAEASPELPRARNPEAPGRIVSRVARGEAVRGASPGTTPSPSETSVDASPPATSPSGSWSFDPRAHVESVVDALALSAGERGAIRRSLGDDAPREEARESLRSALDAHDRSLGLGVGGPLVNDARQAVRESVLPSVGHASIEVIIDGAGGVSSVRVLDASSDRRSWDDVADKMYGEVLHRHVKVPHGAKGVAVTLRLESAMKTASAHDAQEMSVSVFGVPVSKSNAEHPVRLDLALPVAGLNLDPTDALLDATTHPQRVVSVWIADERRL